MKYAILLMIVLLSFSVLAVDASKNVEISEFTGFNIKCSLNGASCPDNTLCNITSKYPNETVWINRTPMTRSGDLFIYEISSPSVTGHYSQEVVCCSGTDCDTDSFLWNLYGEFNYFSCPSSLDEYKIYAILLIILLIIITLGAIFNAGVVILLGGISTVIYATYIYNCSWILSIIIGAVGVMILVRYLARTLNDQPFV